MTLSAKTTSFTLHPLCSNPQLPTPFETVLRCVQFPDEAATGRPRLQRSLNFPSGHVSRISKSHLIEISNEPRSPSPIPRLPIPCPITDTPRAHPRVASLHLQEARIKEKKGEKRVGSELGIYSKRKRGMASLSGLYAATGFGGFNGKCKDVGLWAGLC